MEPAKFTPAEQAALIREAVSWMQQQREKFLPSASELTRDQRVSLAPFFTQAILDRFRIVDLSQSTESIPYPPFYERVRAGGHRLVPDAAHMTAIPFIDVVVFNTEPTLRTIFHNLVHVTQFTLVGLERFMEAYFRTLNESGLWMVVPFEEQAFQLDGRYTRDPADIFSVEDEVREWLRIGRY